MDPAEEDRLSGLPYEVIQDILSFLDMKYAVQTCLLSKRWKNVWISLPILNFNNQSFSSPNQFDTFVTHALSDRNHHLDSSTVDIRMTGAAVATQVTFKSILNYAYLHNVTQLSITWLSRRPFELPECIFSSHTLKHLTLANDEQCHLGGCVYKSVWEFPALETLKLSNLSFGENKNENLDLFSKCVNLKELTLHRCSMFGLGIFHIYAPLLSNLAITDSYVFPTAFDLNAPQLENLTASVVAYNTGVGSRSLFLKLSSERLESLKKVNLYMPRRSNSLKKYAPRPILDLFQKLGSTEFLNLDVGIIEVLSSCTDELLHEPCHFNNLKCLKIEMEPLKPKELVVKNYLLGSSPTATFNRDLSQVSWKRFKTEVDKDALTNKVAKLEEEIKKQNEIIAQMMSKMIHHKMLQLQLQVQGAYTDYMLIRSIGCEIKSVMLLAPESLRAPMEAHLSSLYKEMKHNFFTSIGTSQWGIVERELGISDNVPSVSLRDSNIKQC